MDLVGTVLRGGWSWPVHLNPPTTSSGGATRYQYSSHTTQLFWVPNHALARLDCDCAARCDMPIGRDLVRLLPLLVALLPLGHPSRRSASCRWRGVVAAPDRRKSVQCADRSPGAGDRICDRSCNGRLPGDGGGRHPFRRHGDGRGADALLRAALPAIRVAGGGHPLAAAAGRPARTCCSWWPASSCGSFRWLAFGPSNDLAMRGSIPALVVVALAAADAIAHPARAVQQKVFWPIVLVLAAWRADRRHGNHEVPDEPVWKPDYSSSLVPDSTRTDYPPHYVDGDAGGFVALCCVRCITSMMFGRQSLRRARRSATMKAVILAGGLGSRLMEETSPQAEADGRDRRQADPLAHHEDLLRPRGQRLRHLLRLQGLPDQGVLRQLLPAHVRRHLRHGDEPMEVHQQQCRALAGHAGRHGRGDA